MQEFSFSCGYYEWKKKGPANQQINMGELFALIKKRILAITFSAAGVPAGRMHQIDDKR